MCQANRQTSSEQITTWSYNQAGQVVRRILPNGVRQLFAYDSAGRLSQVKYQKADATLIEQLDYTYDVLGRRTAKTLLNASGAPETPMTTPCSTPGGRKTARRAALVAGSCTTIGRGPTTQCSSGLSVVTRLGWRGDSILMGIWGGIRLA